MYNWAQFLLTFTLFLLLYPATAWAADISVSTWHAAGSQLWRTNFPLHSTVVDGASELYYPHSGKYLMASYENQLSRKQSLFIEGGILTDITTNVGSDSDWDTSKNNNLWYYGQFKTKAKGYFITMDWQQHISNNTSLFYGYTYNSNHYSMTDGLYSIINYTAVNEPLPNLNSYYTMTYQGPHVGITHNHPLTTTTSAFSSLSYSPWSLAQGHGWWNLRSLDFKHVGTAQMLDTKIGLRFTPKLHNTVMTIGYRYQHFKLRKGWENLSPDISWEKATAIRQGYFFSGEMKF